MKKLTLILSSFFVFSSTVILCLSYDTSQACDIAVVSGRVTKSGRPIIWKSRDHGTNWKQEMQYVEPKSDSDAGGSIRVIDRTSTAPLLYEDGAFPPIMSGGSNEAGFAISNTTVYEDDPIHEYVSNANIFLMETALDYCKTVEDFDQLLLNFHKNFVNFDKIISGNFVVIDAKGGAALYEVYSGIGFGAYIKPLKYLKFDANDPEVAPYGFVNRTNSHYWIQRNSDTHREERAYFILETLYFDKNLTVESILIELAKDIYSQGEDGSTISPPGEDSSNYNTNTSISRYMTNLAMVIDGVTSGDNPAYTTFWCNLGEPSVGVSTPHFPFAKKITPYVYAESGLESASPIDETVTCALNQAINDCELTMYDNNWDGGDFLFTRMDKTMDYNRLLEVHEWSLPLEKQVIRETYKVLDQLKSGHLPPKKTLEQTLYDLSHYASGYVYDNYTNESSSYKKWNFNNIFYYGDSSVNEEEDKSKPIIEEEDIVADFSDFIMWFLSMYYAF